MLETYKKITSYIISACECNGAVAAKYQQLHMSTCSLVPLPAVLIVLCSSTKISFKYSYPLLYYNCHYFDSRPLYIVCQCIIECCFAYTQFILNFSIVYLHLYIAYCCWYKHILLQQLSAPIKFIKIVCSIKNFKNFKSNNINDMS